MNAEMVQRYRFVLSFLALGLVFGAVSIVVPMLIAPRKHSGDALQTYESGIVPERGAWRQFSLAYYLYALLYLAVAVDVIYLFPVALVFRLIGTWQALVELLAFVGIVALAVIYSWRTGAFRWE
ncbi:MAG TPA: NADH-quinone oxidoreductase subunit A [Gemmatimonadales bacterium]|jgi:NADH-quinone oxidoreductase subunit A